MKKVGISFCFLVLGFFIVTCALAAEHPGEHPGSKVKEHPGEVAEHPGAAGEHPGKEHHGDKELLSGQDIIDGIKAHIDQELAKNNGFYVIYDTENKKYLKLNLIKVHEDRVSYIKTKDAYFACTDFITTNKMALYDIDFWMKKTPKGLEVYDKKIHKQNGKPRFIYKDDEIVVLEDGAVAPEAPTHAPEAQSF